jgi:hypothetical protein
MDKEYGRKGQAVAINMKANGLMIKNKDMESLHQLKGISTKDITLMI